MHRFLRWITAAVTVAIFMAGTVAYAMTDRCLMPEQKGACCPDGPALVEAGSGCPSMAPAGPELQASEPPVSAVKSLVPIDFVVADLALLALERDRLTLGPQAEGPPHAPRVTSPVRLRVLRI